MSSHEEDDEKDDSQEECSYYGAAAAAFIGIFVGAGITYLASRRNTGTENPQCNASSRNRSRPSNVHSSSSINFRDREKICEICTVCQDDVKYVVTLPCTHFFHYSCIQPWLKRSLSCPTCRKPVPLDFIRNVFKV